MPVTTFVPTQILYSVDVPLEETFDYSVPVFYFSIVRQTVRLAYWLHERRRSSSSFEVGANMPMRVYT